MNKVTRISVALGLITSLVLATGCFGGPEPDKEPKDMIKEAITGMQDASSYSYKLSLDGDLEGPEGEVPETIKFNGTLAGLLNIEDTEKPAFSLAVDGSALIDSDPEQSLSAELRFVDNVLYAQLTKLPLPEEAVPAELADTFLNIWWSYPLPAELTKEFSVIAGGGDAELTEEQKKLKELFQNSDFLNPEYVGVESVAGTDSFKYKINFDKDGFVKFVEDVGRERSEPISAQEKADLEESMKAVELNGYVYVAAGDMRYISKIEGEMKIDAEAKGTIGFAWENSDVDKGLKVEVPEGAQPFSPLFLAGLGLLGSQPLAEDATATGDTALIEDKTPAELEIEAAASAKTPDGETVKRK